MGRAKHYGTRLKFNRAPGRHSAASKRRYDRFMLQVHQRLQDKSYKVARRPYQICRQTYHVNGKPCVKIVVREIQQKKLRGILRPESLRLGCTTAHGKPLEGNRIMDMRLLGNHLSTILGHTSNCQVAISSLAEGARSFEIMGEIRKCGFASTLVGVCKCGKKFFMDTSAPVPTQLSIHDVNLRAVWGTMATGGGLSQLNETFATIDVPGMSAHTFTRIEHTIGSMWSTCLQDDLEAAAAEEKRLAIERNNFHDGVPAIAVICDGGWSKRRHKHTYDALGGVGVIFGAVTGKLLHIGIRNRHCHICTIAETKNMQAIPHECFKNWTASSQAMEADIIAEGFSQAESQFGLRYTTIIADGDSSVFSKIQESIPVWGKDVVKMECANHSCKCLRSSLEKLVVDKPHYKGKGKLTRLVRIRLTTAVRCAIRMRSAEGNSQKATKQLEMDIRNSVHHIFGDHRNCSDFCKSRASPIPSGHAVPPPSTIVEPQDDDTVADQQAYWEEGTAEEDMEESRHEISYEATLDRDILRDVSILLDRLASKASRLIGNYTTNLAESWMSIRAKFDGGKMVNRCKRGSWHARCYGGALRKNYGPAWSPIVFGECTTLTPGQAYASHYRKRAHHHIRSIKNKQKPEVKGRARKRKMKSTSVASSKRARESYGDDVIQSSEDITPAELEKKCASFVDVHVNLSDAKCDKVEKSTKSQSLSVTWKEERRIRLTSSRFGEVMSKNTKRPVKPLVDRLLYRPFRGNQYTQHGLGQESATIKEYVQYMADHDRQETVTVNPMGLVIDRTSKWLAASTDGMVRDKEGTAIGLVEIKNILQKNQLTFQEAVKQQQTFCLQSCSTGTTDGLHLKRSHAYYYQCQGQLNILNMPWLDFVLRRTNPNQLRVERIYKDSEFWKNSMVPKLTAFYKKAILPELAVPRQGLSPGIREPDKPWYVPSDQQLKARQSTTPSSRKATHARQPAGNSSPVAGGSGIGRCDPLHPQGSGNPVPRRSKRRRFVKFTGRKIRHEWCIDEESGTTEWYTGHVLDCVKGRDGEASADYEVLYDGDDDKCIISLANLQEDLDNSSLKFIDV